MAMQLAERLYTQGFIRFCSNSCARYRLLWKKKMYICALVFQGSICWYL